MRKIKELFILLRENHKKIIIVLSMLVVIVTVVVISKKYILKNEQKEIYEVAIMVRSQHLSDPKEDARSSLKIGDVLLAKKDSHKWSQTEKVSYLILAMNLTEEQFRKLTIPVEKKLTKDEVKKEMEQFKQGKTDTSQEELVRFKKELVQRRKTVVMRKYRVKMEEFEDFKANDLINGQPFDGEIFDWRIVEEK